MHMHSQDGTLIAFLFLFALAVLNVGSIIGICWRSAAIERTVTAKVLVAVVLVGTLIVLDAYAASLAFALVYCETCAGQPARLTDFLAPVVPFVPALFSLFLLFLTRKRPTE